MPMDALDLIVISTPSTMTGWLVDAVRRTMTGWLVDAIRREEPSTSAAGAMLLGNAQAVAVARVAVDDDGQVHLTILPGSVEKNRYLLDRTVA